MRHVGDNAGSKSKPLTKQISGMSLTLGIAWLQAALALVHWLARTPRIGSASG